MKRHTLYIIGILIGCAFSSCRKIEIVVPSEYELVSDGIHPEANPQGMYLVNEGIWEAINVRWIIWIT